MPKKAKWIVRLGEHEWIRHTYARLPGDALRLIGSVHRGAQIGALAETLDGQYVQVVGDLAVPLNRSQLAKAINKAKAQQMGGSGYFAPRPSAAPAVVIVKRRRIPVLA